MMKELLPNRILHQPDPTPIYISIYLSPYLIIFRAITFFLWMGTQNGPNVPFL